MTSRTHWNCDLMAIDPSEIRTYQCLVKRIELENTDQNLKEFI